MNQGQVMLWEFCYKLITAAKSTGNTTYEIPVGHHAPTAAFKNMISCQDKPSWVNDCSRSATTYLLLLVNKN